MDLLIYAYLNIGVLLNALVINNVRSFFVESLDVYQKTLLNDKQEKDEDVLYEAHLCKERINMFLSAAVIINVLTSVIIYSLVLTSVVSVTIGRMFGLYGFVGILSLAGFFVSIVTITEFRNKYMNLLIVKE